ncbi:ParA family protein [Azotobacter chroococcum subsp. isscasi]|uniref:tyrosine-protein kinase family protein n=1 Tax=Azotobacter chroococcum TaxID=353 RepID=UPI00103AF0B1|nr:AAA family ATPase [Azotobacter chroococcum]TBW06376.1 ParA family protein [Azotobacter chroococcum subsp. isscasi]
MRPIKFNDALRLAAEAANNACLPKEWQIRLVRDIYGRLRFAVDAYRPYSLEVDMDEGTPSIPDGQRYPADAHQILIDAALKLGRYATSQQALFRDDFSNPDSLFKNPDWHETVLPQYLDADGVEHPELTVQLLDRQIIGQDWLRTKQDPDAVHPPRIVFYGLKGGVGRSTALAMLAYRLARDGKRVLLIDFDLESPGLSGLLLPPERVASNGLVDWFLEDAVGQGEIVLNDLLSDSPLADNTPGSIRIAAAMGQGEQTYLSKLSRVYADVPSTTGPQRFAQRMARIVEILEQQERPDVVLIDSRAGLHDVAAVAISSLATVALLFATDTEQTWQGYAQLFKHWNRHPSVLRDVRERLAIVQAQFPESDQQQRAERFVQRAYDLFAENLYDQIEPGAEPDPESFSFAPDAEDAPHFPFRVRWNARFQEFNPLAGREVGGIDDTDVELAFGPFFEKVIDSIAELRP